MTSLVTHFRSTLDFFENRDRAMTKYYPEKFSHWRRGDRHFNLIDTDNRRVIRFEPNKFVIRTEGHDSLDKFKDCIDISLEMLTDFFKVKDILFIQIELFQIKQERSLHYARSNFAKKYLSEKHNMILPMNGDTDYSITFERIEKVDDNFNTIKVKPYKKINYDINYFIVLGPVTGDEIKNKFLEFKEDSDLVQYQTHALVPDYAQLCGIKLSLKPDNNVNLFSIDTINKFTTWSIDKANSIWSKISEA